MEAAGQLKEACSFFYLIFHIFHFVTRVPFRAGCICIMHLHTILFALLFLICQKVKWCLVLHCSHYKYQRLTVKLVYTILSVNFMNFVQLAHYWKCTNPSWK